MDTAHVMETTEPIESPKKRSKKKRDSEQESQKYSSPSKSKSKSKSKTEDPIAEDTDTAKEPLTQPSTSTDPKPKPKKSKDKSKKKQSTDETSSPTAPNPIPEPTETPIEPTNDTTTSTKDQNTPASPEKKKPKRDKHRLREPKPPAPTEPAPEPTKPKQKKRKNKTEFPDPLQDESLSEQSQKALDYAFLKSNSPSDWKFNKARQNWLIRNVWSTESIPDDHLPLTLKYLSSVQGGSRDKLKETCTTILNPPIIPAPTSIETTVEDKPTELVKSILKGSTNTDPSTPTPDSATKPKAGALIEVPKEAPKVDHKPKRAKAILDALRESS
ncbi:hypothetical protein FA15DRAFT_666773 [Coprinopsis marcescibilis]|uniref:WKF domain-containing protein n=1 Tax=Coprinopsis marcescibilis TaxID=230819 RepID=A0A5C3L2Q8_COPMA|nr:hypothetical protein FA15DRAFT_666773 [Coprinopsis marcescibilis]